MHNCRLEIQNFNTRREISYLHTVKASIYISQKNAFLSLTVEAILSCLLYCFYPGIVQVIRVGQLRTDQGVQRPNWCLCDWWYYSRYLPYVPHILIKIWTLFNFSDTKFLMAYIFFSCRSNYKCKWWGGKSVNLFEKFKITWCT